MSIFDSFHQMDNVTFLFIALVLVLFIGQYLYVESFVDASDNSGTNITLSLKDILTLFATAKPTPKPNEYISEHNKLKKEYQSTKISDLDKQFYSDLKTQILSDVRESVRNELKGSPLLRPREDTGMVSDECINSFVNRQGTDFMKYIPGKNPSDYIRKDSIPCYACNVE
jgi:hypothetical protein